MTPIAPVSAIGPARRVRMRVAIVLAVVLAVAAAVWTTQGTEQYPDAADPRNPGPDGAQAVARVLADQGVEVRIARSADALEEVAVDGDTTVVVTSTEQLAPSTLARLREHAAAAGRVVLVEPRHALLQEIDPGLGSVPVPADEDDAVAARCADGIEGVAVDGLTVAVDQATSYAGEGCFPIADGALVRTVDGLVLFGAGDALTNDQVTRADNAAVALRLLGHDGRLVWYVPDAADAVGDDAVTIGSLLPDWIGPGLWVLALSGSALVLWRFRRLGPLSTEPLPVVVRAVETARSRGRMYRRSGDRAHAAHALRRAACADLAAVLRLDRGAPPPVVAETAARLLDAPVESIAALLDADRTPPPATDQDLVRFAQDLAQLRREVRRS
ncbi:DUF4350 domain-containing protein [Nocardioides carbamazepini]|uniref:DUF4350 domain-containing protein n=1 Tax=Nocardioides carbamazepini TaxID=2854259 RepID=UPI00214A2BAB|nr:DUF4350 domain-containing protein [Nocardioides carbamazepini]MCR1786543.1 DUF4350 domain-containing protein [Nocardioides carbamazepini]